MKKQNVYLIGLGAIGCALAAQAADNGNDISIICDEERKKKYQAKPFEINGRAYHFNYVSEVKEQEVDVLLISVKFHHLLDALTTVKPFVSDKTIILSLLNGIRSEAIIEEELQTKYVLPAFVIGTDAKKYGNEVKFTKNGKIVLGTTLKEQEAILHKTSNCLNALGITAEISTNIVNDMWWKLMVNVGINQISALFQITYVGFSQNEEIKSLTRMAMQEVVTIAQAMDINLSEKDIEELFELSKSWGAESKSSMLQDIENNRVTEVDIFGGEICRLGETLNIPTPINRFLYHSIKYLESKVQA